MAKTGIDAAVWPSIGASRVGTLLLPPVVGKGTGLPRNRISVPEEGDSVEVF